MTINTKNLTTLANYLSTLPDDYEQFGMNEFFSNSNPDEVAAFIRDNGGVKCGSVACAIGHGPTAGIKLDLTAHEFTNQGDYWEKYCQEAFGVEWHSQEAEWMFGGEWDSFDNTPSGAAARIRYFLKEGVPVTNEGQDTFDTYDMLWDDELAEQMLSLYQTEEYMKPNTSVLS